MKRNINSLIHVPVLKEEVISQLGLDRFAHLKKKGIIVDATVGLGGHAVEILKKGCDVIGVDSDEEVLKIARKNLTKACPVLTDKHPNFRLIKGNFKDIDILLKKENVEAVDGILFDLGINSFQLSSQGRGFSFANLQDVLDMRIDQSANIPKASDLLNLSSKKDLINLFSVTCEYKDVRKLVASVIDRRKVKAIESVSDFNKIIAGCLKQRNKLDISTLPFLALRIAVNRELENLRAAIVKSLRLVTTGGKIVVISFHSGEDKIVKEIFDGCDEGLFRVLTVKPVVPGVHEKYLNIRSRSAKMRVIEKLL